MNLFKRLTVTVRSQLDDAVSRIENHDAVIDAALKESRRETGHPNKFCNKYENRIS